MATTVSNVPSNTFFSSMPEIFGLQWDTQPEPYYYAYNPFRSRSVVSNNNASDLQRLSMGVVLVIEEGRVKMVYIEKRWGDGLKYESKRHPYAT